MDRGLQLQNLYSVGGQLLVGERLVAAFIPELPAPVQSKEGARQPLVRGKGFAKVFQRRVFLFEPLLELFEFANPLIPVIDQEAAEFFTS